MRKFFADQIHQLTDAHTFSRIVFIDLTQIPVGVDIEITPLDHAEVGSIPEIRAKNIDAAIIHEAAIGRINDEQLLKLRTLGLTEEEAEEVIIQNFLN